MLATPGPLPRGAGWAYEFKWDGVRAITSISGGTVHLYARSGAEITVAYPELVGLGQALGDAVLDGEIVALDERGRPSFTRLAERMHVRDAPRAHRLAASQPVTYMLFDILALYGSDVTAQAYAERRLLLESLDLADRRWLVSPRFDDGPATVAAAEEHALEGVVAKRLTSVYRPGLRSPDWVKVKREHTEDFVIGGWRPGVRALGALLVGVSLPDGRLDYRGRVGGGISDANQRALLGELHPRGADSSPFVQALPRDDARDAHWVRPELVVEVRYGNRTPDGRLRFPRFVRLRPDKSPRECVDG
ncbi:MAG TPA: non-homologous end-joining DNA ligase [Rugosimonospora sp.]|nr:non-homologous end-joining DNA ligase [Rugosimonospora sp.]